MEQVTETLEEGEAHPASHTALAYLRKHGAKWAEAIYSCALTDNRTAQIAAGTLKRLENKEPVSDRYLMGLAWFIYELEGFPKSPTKYIRQYLQSGGVK